MNETKTKILIVEDHHATMDGLSMGIGAHQYMDVVGTAMTSDEGLAQAASCKPDVIVLDLHLPGATGPRATIEAFKQAAPGARLIIFSAEARMALIQSVTDMGVAAYLLKSERVAKVIETIQRVMAGEKGIISESVPQVFKKITRAEMEVLSMLARGMKYQEIADQRMTSMATVRKQCETLELKLNLASREQLIACAVENGF